jgi:hypothetical protein
MADELSIHDSKIRQSPSWIGRNDAEAQHKVSQMKTAPYEGRARLGHDHGIEVTVRIPDVEDPNWMAVIVDIAGVASKIGEVRVTLLDGDRYEGWRGTAVVSKGGDNRLRLMGHEPLAPPSGE